MFKILARKSTDAAIDYFLCEPELTAEERTGHWLGDGARALGLGPGLVVNEADLRAVLNGVAPPASPQAGRLLNGRYVTVGRRVAYDVVLSPHKSVSVVALCLGGEMGQRVHRAFGLAVQATFEVVERFAQRRHGSFYGATTTGSLLAARYDHGTSRHADPHLHAHLLIANVTRDRAPAARRKWYGLEPLFLFRLAREFGQVFQRELARYLRLEGLVTHLRREGRILVASLPAVPRALCRRLARAHEAIIRLANELPRRTAHERAMSLQQWQNWVNDRTRPSKRGSRQRADGRSVRFANALSAGETADIVAGLPARPEVIASPDTAPALTAAGDLRLIIPFQPERAPRLLSSPKQYAAMVLAAFRTHGVETLVRALAPRTPRTRLRAALLAASTGPAGPDLPLLPFVTAALSLPAIAPAPQAVAASARLQLHHRATRSRRMAATQELERELGPAARPSPTTVQAPSLHPPLELPEKQLVPFLMQDQKKVLSPGGTGEAPKWSPEFARTPTPDRGTAVVSQTATIPPLLPTPVATAAEETESPGPALG